MCVLYCFGIYKTFHANRISIYTAQTQRLVDLGCLGVILVLLHWPRTAEHTVNVALKSLLEIFAKGDHVRDATGQNPYAVEFQRSGGVTTIVGCRHHHVAEIATLASRIYDTYFDTPPSLCASPTSVVDCI